MAPHKCAYFRCNNKSNKRSMFRFPVNYKNRLKIWLENCGNMTLSHLPPERLRSRFLCIDHFEKKFILKRKFGKRVILTKGAIPEPYREPYPEPCLIDEIKDERCSPSPSSPEPELKVLPPKRVYEKKEKPREIRAEPANIEHQILARRTHFYTVPKRRHSADMTDAEKFADVRRKWSHIRNSYSRHLRNEMHGARTGKGRMVSRWYLADELEFLREHMATDIRPTFSSYPSMVEIESLNGSDQDSKPEPGEPFINPWFAMNQAKVEPKREAFSNDDSCSSAFDPDENSSFFQFFRGIYNDFQDLPPKKQRLFKRKCLDFLHELLDEDDVPASMVYQRDAINLTRFSRPSSDDERDHPPFCVVEKVEPCIDSPTA